MPRKTRHGWGKWKKSPELAPRPKHRDSADLPTFQAAAQTGLECSMSPPSPRLLSPGAAGRTCGGSISYPSAFQLRPPSPPACLATRTTVSVSYLYVPAAGPDPKFRSIPAATHSCRIKQKRASPPVNRSWGGRGTLVPSQRSR